MPQSRNKRELGHTITFNRALIALGWSGAAADSLEETVEYARQRHTFGRPAPGSPMPGPSRPGRTTHQGRGDRQMIGAQDGKSTTPRDGEQYPAKPERGSNPVTALARL